MPSLRVDKENIGKEIEKLVSETKGVEYLTVSIIPNHTFDKKKVAYESFNDGMYMLEYWYKNLNK